MQTQSGKVSMATMQTFTDDKPLDADKSDDGIDPVAMIGTQSLLRRPLKTKQDTPFASSRHLGLRSYYKVACLGPVTSPRAN